MSFMVENRIAVVTGGSSGIGLETVRLLLASGARVAFCGRNEERLADAERQLKTEFPDADLLARPCDVLDADSCRAFASAVETGLGRADMLIANAGQGFMARYDDTPQERWLGEANLKLFGVINPLDAFRPHLAASDIGSLTCVNSLLAVQPEPYMIATSAARAALLNMTHSLADTLVDEGIRVNSILLGVVESGQWRRRYENREDRDLSWEDWTARIAEDRGVPMKRLGKPEEPARALVFLASPLASFTTGAALDVSGGFNRHI
ncbi:SDR family oxidoreductase [Saccharospirillum salsuginis]|uniref:Short chain dehydrogenase n=1 Tax=Saccharospirillum salsuginis TaxID=418750 RepID=A0A918K205_9GAMM|nr:SDR family oxidoreductase [Saccharospirillum salsuginis]GGX45212.1 short chain dehydrogenase [Saccharospirillum salsuginis]